MSAGISSKRKVALAAAAALSLAAIVGARATIGHSSRAQDQAVASDAAPAPPLTRYSVSDPKANIASVRAGVLAMMALDCAPGHTAPACEQEANGTKPNAMLSPLGWKYQAYIHGRPPVTVNRDAWNTCQHSTWFFLSWHRMELYFFERILRKASGNATLTLPYWDFFDERILPADFRMQLIATKPNALWWKFRNSGVNKENNPVPLPLAAVESKEAFRQTAFFTNVTKNGLMSFGGGASQIDVHLSDSPGEGQIENTPHNAVHGAVGCAPPACTPAESTLSMSNPDAAGLDPIFWPVHANIDRSWSCWQQNHTNPPTEPKSDAWLNTVKFDFFDVQDAAPGFKKVTMSGKDIINTANITVEGKSQLGYKYDNNCKGFQVPTPVPMVDTAALPSSTAENPAASKLSHIELSAAAESHAILAAEPLTVSIPLSSQIQERIRTLIQSGAPAGSILLSVGGIAVDEPTAAWYEIFLSFPPGAVPDEQTDRHVGNLSFFGMGHHHDESTGAHASSPESFVYDITDVVRYLIANRAWPSDQLSVTFLNPAADEPQYAYPPPAPDYVHARFSNLTLTVK